MAPMGAPCPHDCPRERPVRRHSTSRASPDAVDPDPPPRCTRGRCPHGVQQLERCGDEQELPVVVRRSGEGDADGHPDVEHGAERLTCARRCPTRRRQHAAPSGRSRWAPSPSASAAEWSPGSCRRCRPSSASPPRRSARRCCSVPPPRSSREDPLRRRRSSPPASPHRVAVVERWRPSSGASPRRPCSRPPSATCSVRSWATAASMRWSGCAPSSRSSPSLCSSACPLHRPPSGKAAGQWAHAGRRSSSSSSKSPRSRPSPPSRCRPTRFRCWSALPAPTGSRSVRSSSPSARPGSSATWWVGVSPTGSAPRSSSSPRSSELPLPSPRCRGPA